MLALLAGMALCMWAFYISRISSSQIARAERDLLQREKRLQLALDDVHDGLWQSNLLTDVTFLPASVNQFLDYEPHELESHIGAFLQLVHPDDRQSAHQSITSHVRDRMP